ncbi:lipopolysaccharide heptosyltransferase II [Isoalcanivorax beigongshangi]|uniref:lipopolysaccharide heptosyltransferase II n=1 Tax=Isoalcanivorax beigongshangi TaxID=3238810 RepID=A0ABV4ADM0_9GAMM
MVKAARRVLVVGPSWVGDMVMAQTLFAELRRQDPQVLIDVLAPDWCRPLLARMPEVRSALSLPFGHGELRLGERRSLGRQFRGHYDQAIVLPNSLKSALLPYWTATPVRTGWRGELRYGLLNDVRVLDPQRYPLMVQRFVALGRPAQAPVPARDEIIAPALRVDMNQVEQTLANLGLNRALPVLALCPGAEFGPAKRWPEDHYAEVARHQLEQGWQVWIFGSAKDREVAEQIRDLIPEKLRWRLHILAGDTTLNEAVDLLSEARAVVSNDSGLMHIAAALHRPLVAVYGSTSPDFTPPLHDQVAIVRLGLDCSPCFKRECPLGHLDCLRQLPASRVLEALEQVLA